MILLITISIIFVSYIAYVWIKDGIQDSISESYLVSEHPFLFPVFCLSIGYGSFFLAWQLGNIYLALSGISMASVGLLPDITIKKIRIKHYVVAIASVVFSQLAIYHFGDLFLNILFFVSGSTFYIFRWKIKEIWWIEILAISFTLLSTYMEL